MTVVLGIDTGGTYTDAVLVNYENGKILSHAKSVTTHQDLSIGIHAAVTSVMTIGRKAVSRQKICLVGLSTTLATNAIAQGHGAPVCLLLIGYDRDLIHQYRFQQALGTPNVVYLQGGHDQQGIARHPLDKITIKNTVLNWSKKIDAFGVSGYFGAFNPEHELQVKKWIEDLTDLPVTCGHELSTRLDAIRRATTVALNARLIPIIQDLIFNVRATLKTMSIPAPLMVVKGDGSLVQADWAVKRPIETVLSGPAASALGALSLTGNKNTWVVDMGGTTTDIVELIDGAPSLNPDGACIGGWRTMVEAVDVHTVGLGGDSHVRVDSENQLVIGPDRVIPICKLASEYPDRVLKVLKTQMDSNGTDPGIAQFLLPGKTSPFELSENDARLMAQLKNGPEPLMTFTAPAFFKDPWISRRIQHLIETGLIYRAGFTPTDALHALDRFQEWHAEASRMAGKLLSNRLGLSTEAFCTQLVRSVSRQAAAAIVSKAITDETGTSDWKQMPLDAFLLNKALDQNRQGKLIPEIRLNHSIVALGAPVKAYLPTSADILQTGLSIPRFAAVANAVGAVSGKTVLRVRARIRPINGSRKVRLLSPNSPRDFDDVEEAVQYALNHMTALAEKKARQSGAEHVQVQVIRKEKRAKAGSQKEVFLETELTFMALGRPAMAFNRAS
jgi:N-methylhydantoinase A/oxoprolinase/acetone carboxylase beta subunit